jgi:hypothetical protein
MAADKFHLNSPAMSIHKVTCRPGTSSCETLFRVVLFFYKRWAQERSFGSPQCYPKIMLPKKPGIKPVDVSDSFGGLFYWGLFTRFSRGSVRYGRSDTFGRNPMYALWGWALFTRIDLDGEPWAVIQRPKNQLGAASAPHARCTFIKRPSILCILSSLKEIFFSQSQWLCLFPERSYDAENSIENEK